MSKRFYVLVVPKFLKTWFEAIAKFLEVPKPTDYDISDSSSYCFILDLEGGTSEFTSLLLIVLEPVF